MSSDKPIDSSGTLDSAGKVPDRVESDEIVSAYLSHDKYVRRLEGFSVLADIEIQGTPTAAVVDTAAMVTLVSSSLFRKFSDFTPVGPAVTLKGLGDSPIPAFRVPDVEIRLGSRTYNWSVCVTEMKDDMILGLDFLHAIHSKVDLGLNSLEVNGEVIPTRLQGKGVADETRRVVLTHSVSIPPNTCGHVRARLLYPPAAPTEVLVQPTTNNRNLLVATTLSSSDNIILQVINDTTKPVRLRKNHHIAFATDFQSVLSPEEEAVYDIRMVDASHSGTDSGKETTGQEALDKLLASEFCLKSLTPFRKVSSAISSSEVGGIWMPKF